MFIQSLKTHFTARTLEWFGAGVMTHFGYYILTHPQLFTQDQTKELFSGLVTVAAKFGQAPQAIGVVALLTGLLRATALFINGSYSKTPLIRLITAFASMYFWTNIVLGFTLSNVANTGLVVYPWWLLADVVSSYRAGYDLVIAENIRKQSRLLNGQRTDGRLRSRLYRAIFPAGT
jgi:hypothetical protein